MAFYNKSPAFFLPILLITLASMSGNTMVAEARHLLEFPSLADFPTIPELPEIPKFEVPHFPSVPELPEIIPKVDIPKFPDLPELPKIPTLKP